MKFTTFWKEKTSQILKTAKEFSVFCQKIFFYWTVWKQVSGGSPRCSTELELQNLKDEQTLRLVTEENWVVGKKYLVFGEGQKFSYKRISNSNDKERKVWNQFWDSIHLLLSRKSFIEETLQKIGARFCVRWHKGVWLFFFIIR